MSGGQPERKKRRGDEDEWTVCTGEEGFQHKFNVRRLRMAPDVTSIGRGSFSGCCDYLVEVDLCNVTDIGIDAFDYCTSLTSVDLSKVTVIGVTSFCGCESLKSISIPPSAVEIGRCAFAGCTGLVEVELCPGQLERVGGSVFERCTSLERIVIPPTVVDLGERAFWCCESLISVSLPEGLEVIEDYAFSGCTSLENVIIPSTVVNLGRGAFEGCKGLVSIGLSEGLKAIGECSFYGCTSLDTIRIPSTLVELGSWAFKACSNLSKVELTAGGVLTLRSDPLTGRAAFDSCPSLELIIVPSPTFVISCGAGDVLECRLSQEGAISLSLELVQVVSKCVKYMAPNQLTEAQGKINEILSQDGQTEEQKLEKICVLFDYYELLDAMSLLELAIWKASIGNDVGRDRASRQALRASCGRGMQIIIAGVLRYLS